jgi:glycosyltransferase involved in cell wall biosynthesis
MHNLHLRNSPKKGFSYRQIPRGELPWPVRYFLSVYIPILERVVVKYTANHIITVSSNDKSRLIEKYGVAEEKIAVIPSGAKIINLKTIDNKNETRKGFGIRENEIVILFHGSYSYHPNKEAIDLIIDYVAPIIGKEFENVLFLLAGNGTPIVEKMNVKSIGFVEDLYSLLNIADIAIVPILQGGGTRLKILDYMGVGVPIVTTKKGIEGINAKNSEHAIIVDDVNEEFIDAVILLVNNKEERERIGANSRRLVEEEYDWDKIGEKLEGLYRDILEDRMLKGGIKWF